MEEKLPLPPRSEYSITAENFTLQLMIDRESHREPTIDHTLLLTLHTHAYAEIFVCCSGVLTIITASGTVSLTEGELVIVPAEFPHYRDPKQSFGHWHSVGILPIRRRTRGCRNLYRMLSGLCFAEKTCIIRGKPEICTEVAALCESNWHPDSCLPALAMLHLLMKLVTDNQSPVMGNHITPIVGEINRVAQLEHMIDVYFTNDLTAKDIADELFISQRQLTRIVKRRFGMTLHETIRKKRVTAAAMLLLESSMSAEQIGVTVGFRSKSCFYQAFGREYGMTPIRYRELYHK